MLRTFDLCAHISDTVTELTLSKINCITDEGMNGLGNHTKLKILTLSGTVLDDGDSFDLNCVGGSFPQLEVFEMRNLKLREWKLGNGGMPWLQSVIIRSCTRLDDLPNELWSLNDLRKVQVSKEQLKQVITEAEGEKEFPDSSSDFRAIKASYHRGSHLAVCNNHLPFQGFSLDDKANSVGQGIDIPLREGVFGEWLILLEGSGLLKDQKFVDEILSRTPIKRIAEPEEVSSLVTFLCFPGASYITGQPKLPFTRGEPCLGKTFRGIGQTRLRHDVANKIDTIKTTLKEIRDNKDKYDAFGESNNQSTTKRRRRKGRKHSHKLRRNVEEEGVVGFGHDSKVVINRALESYKKGKKNTREITSLSEEELKNAVRNDLESKTYLVVVDDSWKRQDWDEVQDAFPDNNNGKVFRGEYRPSDLEALGKKMVQSCHGLPLSVIVLAGSVANKEKSHREWSKVVGHVNWYLTQEHTQVKDIVLKLDYDNLPRRLKPCFLYFGIFPEDFEIPVTQLLQKWVAEGFIQDTGNRDLDEVAEDYLYELIDHSLVKVAKVENNGGVKTCRVHDLLRDLCISKSKENKVYEVCTDNNILISTKPRKLSIHE
ncbi:hypothetical protein ACSQ67_022013 [Phaseolus vulgaris]